MNISLMWFRQDLRVSDNPAFFNACSNHENIIPLYIYDESTSVLGSAQRWWLHHSLIALTTSLQKYGLTLVLRKGNPEQIITELTQQFAITTIYWNRLYEPLFIERDKKIKATLLANKNEVKSFNGSLLHEPWTIKNKNGDFFKIFTPFWKHCLQIRKSQINASLENIPKLINTQSDNINDWCLLPQNPNWAKRFSDDWQPGEIGAEKKLNEFIKNKLLNYTINRDIPAKNSTSRLSPHLHFGEISPWAVKGAIEIAKLETACDLASADRFLSELGWREFSYHLLYHFPNLPHQNFKRAFDSFPWEENEVALLSWQEGKTGYPIIDAGMRELWATGYMHNRVRMIVASFLTKDLLIDWRIGANWFLDTLVDADLANNSASWQWVAGCGADAAPYFRIFNPVLQSQKFDPEGRYIKQWVPELANKTNVSIHEPWLSGSVKGYPERIIAHDMARKRALACYKHIT